jgi:hypothetical protein
MEIKNGTMMKGGPSDESGEEDSDGDEYIEGGFIKPKRARKRSENSSPFISEPSTLTSRRLTTRQRRDCRRAFALFFPDVEDIELDHQKIMPKDLDRVGRLIKEKLKAEEVCISSFHDQNRLLMIEIRFWKCWKCSPVQLTSL